MTELPEPVVQKYGGSSLATPEQLARIARRIADVHRAGCAIVVVVSAMGGATDDLLRLAKRLAADPTPRELDGLLATGESAAAALLAIALVDIGLPAQSLTGAQTGILAVGTHGNGRIAAIDTRRLDRVLAAGQVAVVAGFQGVTVRNDTITLGRGGSDTTAVALAVELGIGHCEIYTDVDGVHTADPRVVPNARLIRRLDTGVMAEMAFAGAKVLHSRSVELAAAHGIDVHVRRWNSDRPGTVVSRDEQGATMLEENGTITGIAHDLDYVRMAVRFRECDAEIAPAFLASLAEHAVGIDVVEWSRPGGNGTVSFTVPRVDVGRVRLAVEQAKGTWDEAGEDVGKVSVIGIGLLSRPSYNSHVLAVLAGAGIPVRSVSMSQMRTTVTVPPQETARAVCLLHRAFQLDRTRPARTAGRSEEQTQCH